MKIPVALPYGSRIIFPPTGSGVSLSMRVPFPDPVPLVEAGVPIALATDANPGTSYVLTMPLIIALGCLEMGMSPEAALWSATRGGALALQRPHAGMLTHQAAGDLVVLNAESYTALPYRPDDDIVTTVVTRGRIAA